MNIEQKAREVALNLPLMRVAGSVEAPTGLWTNVIAAALQSAVAEEREECAKEADTIERVAKKIGSAEKAFGANCAAVSIRARGQKETA